MRRKPVFGPLPAAVGSPRGSAGRANDATGTPGVITFHLYDLQNRRKLNRQSWNDGYRQAAAVAWHRVASAPASSVLRRLTISFNTRAASSCGTWQVPTIAWPPPPYCSISEPILVTQVRLRTLCPHA